MWATLDVLENAKNDTRKAALKRSGSSKMFQAREMAAKVERSNIPLGLGDKVELIDMLLR